MSFSSLGSLSSLFTSLNKSKILLFSFYRSKYSLSRIDILLLLLIFFCSFSFELSKLFRSNLFCKSPILSSFYLISFYNSVSYFFSSFLTDSNSSSWSCKFWISRMLFSSAFVKIYNRSLGWNLIISLSVSCSSSSCFYPGTFSVRYRTSLLLPLASDFLMYGFQFRSLL